ncbi:MAG: hypothetical protein H7138_19485, partial [Myxococcales bacterium]|nr:hypothetical protein [Myxococcales bacterium]
MYGAELPFGDPSVAALSMAQRTAIAGHWKHRARSELQVGRAFAAMVPVLRERHASAAVLDRLARGADEEIRHSEICAQLAETYAGEAVVRPQIDSVALPRFDVGDDELETALLVAGMCCINETIATAWISACLAAAKAPLAMMANRIHLHDEIEHARVGWAHLASDAVSDETRQALGLCLPRLLEANAPGWEREDASLPAEGVPDQGHLPFAVSRRVFLD